MKELSPSAQAILDAAKLPSKCYARSIAAAILRAATDQVAPEDFDYWDGRTNDYALEYETGQNERNAHVRAELLAIADELDGHA